jgi:hypothetical protein
MFLMFSSNPNWIELERLGFPAAFLKEKGLVETEPVV